MLDTIEALKRWKEEALIIFDDLNLQEIGKELDLPLGANVAPAILPWIQMMKKHVSNNRGVIGTWAINADYWAKVYGHKPKSST